VSETGAVGKFDRVNAPFDTSKYMSVYNLCIM